MRSITENADYLLQAIDWINGKKKNNASGVREQNIVMGISMGGLVSRYALAKRTKQTGSNSTETKQLFTFDSPHQGANVPLGFQHFLYDFGEVRMVRKIKNVSEQLQDFYKLNLQPATQEQLLFRVTDGDGNRVANTFLASGGTYRTMVDYVAPYQFLAISNGSQCAVPVFAPGTLLLQKSGNVGTANWLSGFLMKNKYRLSVQVNALPSYGTQAQIASVVMERNIRFFLGAVGTGWSTTSNSQPRISPPNTIPWDGVPGGIRDAEADGSIAQNGQWPTIGKTNTFFGNVWRGIVGAIINLDYDINFPFAQRYFTFVPITSALDVANVTSSTFSQPFNFVVSGLNGSRANKFVTQEFYGSLYNAPHTEFTPRNAEWIYNEMQLATQPFNCKNYCTTAYTISGPSNFCVSSVYSVEGLVPGSTITWSASAPNMVQFSCATCAQTTITRLYSGVITLTATINDNCGGGTVTLTTTVTIGVPDQNSLYGIFSTEGYSNYLQDDNCLKTYTFPGMYSGEVSLTDPITNTFSWSFVSKYPSTATVSIGGSADGRNMTVTVKPAGARVVYKLTRTNGCGSYSHDYTFTANGICSVEESIFVEEENLRLAPNPSTGTFNVLLQSTDKDKAIKMIVVRNKFGAEMKRIHFTGNAKSQNINIQNFPMDVYSVEVFDGTRWRVQKIIKQ